MESESLKHGIRMFQVVAVENKCRISIYKLCTPGEGFFSPLLFGVSQNEATALICHNLTYSK